YEAMAPAVQALANAYLMRAFRRLGWQFEAGQRFSADAFMDAVGLVAHHRRLVARMLEIFGEHGVLARPRAEWEVRQLVDEADPVLLWRSLWYQFPALQAELMLVRQCGERLAEVLKGDLEPLEVIFPQGSLTTAEHLYQDAPSYRIYNILAQ